MTGSLELLAFFAGQVAGQITRREPAADIVAAMVRDATEILDRLEKFRACGP